MADVTVTYDATTAETAARSAARFNREVADHEKHATKARSALEQLTKAFRMLAGRGSSGGELAHVVGHGEHMGKAFLAAGAAAVALKVTWESIEHISERAVEHAKEYTKLLQEQAKMAREAGEAKGRTALSAAESQGANIRALVGMGGGAMDEANRLTNQGFRATEAQKAVLEARRTFSTDAQASQALAIAARASRITGIGLVESVQAAQNANLGNADEGVAQLVSEARNRTVTISDVRRAEENQRADATVQGIEGVDRARGAQDLNGQSLIASDAVVQARRELAEAVDPLSKAMMDAHREQQEKLDQLISGSEAEWTLVKIWKDSFFAGGSQQSKAAEQAALMAGN